MRKIKKNAFSEIQLVYKYIIIHCRRECVHYNEPAAAAAAFMFRGRYCNAHASPMREYGWVYTIMK